MDAFLRAAAEFVVADLELQAEPSAADAAQRSLDDSGLLLLGEVHGVRENPLLIRALLQMFRLTSLALEWPDDLGPAMAAFLAGETLADHRQLWFGDGRITAGHLAVLAERVGAGPLELTLFDGTIGADWSWSRRDEAMAARIAALTFAYNGHIRAHQPGQLPAVNAFAGIPVSRETVETYLASFASTADELAGKLDASPGSWQMLPIQEKPLLRIGEALLVLDEQYLIERATQGLYWFVHEHERELDGERGWKRWSNAYASMVERRVEDQLRRMAPALLLGGGRTIFTEENLQAAFPKKKNADAGIDYGDLVLLAEVVTTQVSLPARENADVIAYGKNIDKFFVDKARQLDETAANLLRDPQPTGSPLDNPAQRILPVAVRGGQFPVNPVTRQHIDAALKQAGLLNYRRADLPVFPLAPVDLGELEMCETLHETHSRSLPDLIRQWQNSDDYAQSSLRNFLIKTYSEEGFPRPADMRAALAQTLSLIAARLGTTWTPPGAPGT